MPTVDLIPPFFEWALASSDFRWSYGYRQRGTGVYRMMPRSLPHYRESVELRLCWMQMAWALVLQGCEREHLAKLHEWCHELATGA